MSMTLPGFLGRGQSPVQTAPIEQTSQVQTLEHDPRSIEVAAPVGAAAIDGVSGHQEQGTNPWDRLSSLAEDPRNPRARTAAAVIEYFSR